MSLLTSYLLWPIAGLLLLIIGAFIAKKIKIPNRKRMFLYLLLGILLMTAPALLGFLNFNFMPHAYLLIALYAGILGYINISVITKNFNNQKHYGKEVFLFLLIILPAYCLFVLVFNLTNELQYGLWAGTSLLAFAFPSLYTKTHSMFVTIPAEVFKIWHYNAKDEPIDPSGIDYNSLIVLEVELIKRTGDSYPIKIKAKAPEQMPFGTWFKRLITDYNIKSPLSPIDSFSDNDGLGWIFYSKPSILRPRKYIDYDKTFKANRVKERNTIIAKRVKKQTSTQL
ncbi:MAG: TssN family type VI secretion system protein [Bacteroidales bacterium]|nr:TssN family type VI secretion system protein [Bacteroidales bacterium]